MGCFKRMEKETNHIFGFLFGIKGKRNCCAVGGFEEIETEG